MAARAATIGNQSYVCEQLLLQEPSRKKQKKTPAASDACPLQKRARIGKLPAVRHMKELVSSAYCASAYPVWMAAPVHADAMSLATNIRPVCIEVRCTAPASAPCHPLSETLPRAISQVGEVRDATTASVTQRTHLPVHMRCSDSCSCSWVQVGAICSCLSPSDRASIMHAAMRSEALADPSVGDVVAAVGLIFPGDVPREHDTLHDAAGGPSQSRELYAHLLQLGAHTAAACVYYAAVVWMRQQLHVLPLGDATQALHESAIRRRYDLGASDELPWSILEHQNR